MRLKILFSLLLLNLGSYTSLSADSFLQGYSSFVWDLYAQVAKEEEGKNVSIVLSPFSTATVLSMTAAGASSTTLKEMEEVLGYSINEEIIDAQKTVRDSLLPSFQTFQAVALSKKFSLLSSYTSKITSGFDANFFLLDFAANKKQAINTVNDWINARTDKLIPDLLGDQDVSQATRLIILNASHFKKEWRLPFNRASTQKSQFFLGDGTSTQVDMMEQSGYFPLYENEICCVLGVDFKMESDRDDFSSFLILPKTLADMKQVELQLGEGLLDRAKQDAKNRYVQMFLPRFTIRQRLSLKETLIKMGMKEAFSYSKADFSRMSDKELLYIDTVLTEAVIKVDELGCEASGATAAVINMRSSLHPEPQIMRFDKPFIFIIYKKSEGVVLFISRVNGIS